MAQFELVGILFWTILMLKLEEVPMYLGFLNPRKVKSMNPFGFSISSDLREKMSMFMVEKG